MKYIFPFYFLLSFLIINSSCNGQAEKSIREITAKKKIKKVEQPPKEIKAQTEEKKEIIPPQKISKDFDPYFKETEYTSQSIGPQSITRKILEDKNGNIWLASWEGILKYDGTTFTNYTNKDSLRRHHIFTILEDTKGNLWFGTIGGGVYFYDGKEFTNYTTEDKLASNRIGCFYEDKKGNIWVGTMNGLSRYNGKDFKSYIIEGGTNNNDINSIIEDDNGDLWIVTRGTAFTFDGKEFTTITNEDRPFNNVRSIIKDKKGNIWLGGNDGLFTYHNNTFTNHSTEFVGYIYEDSKGRIWTSSTVNKNMGSWALVRYDNFITPLIKMTPTIINPNIGMLFGIEEDSKGNIWFGNLEGVGRYDGKEFEYFRK